MVSISHALSVSARHGICGGGLGIQNVPPFQGIEQQLLRILRCTAQAMATTPGGLRFSPGAQPWLDGLIPGHPGGHAGGGGRDGGVSPTVND